MALGVSCTTRIDLLIADVTPPCCGILVAFQLKAWRPDLRTILTSGYPVNMWDEQQAAELSEIPSDSVRVLQKPFLPKDLLRTVDELIGAARDKRTAARIG